jgi:hypothetical protein
MASSAALVVSATPASAAQVTGQGYLWCATGNGYGLASAPAIYNTDSWVVWIPVIHFYDGQLREIRTQEGERLYNFNTSGASTWWSYKPNNDPQFRWVQNSTIQFSDYFGPRPEFVSVDNWVWNYTTQRWIYAAKSGNVFAPTWPYCAL